MDPLQGVGGGPTRPGTYQFTTRPPVCAATFTVTASPPNPPDSPEIPGTLPFTGTHTPMLLLIGGGLLAAGAGLLLLLRRVPTWRRRRTRHGPTRCWQQTPSGHACAPGLPTTGSVTLATAGSACRRVGCGSLADPRPPGRQGWS